MEDEPVGGERAIFEGSDELECFEVHDLFEEEGPGILFSSPETDRELRSPRNARVVVLKIEELKVEVLFSRVNSISNLPRLKLRHVK